MALVLKDRVKETTTTTGTGTYTLAGAVTGFEAFSEVGDGNTTYYACTDGTDFEVGIGTYTASGTTLARTTILQSSNADAAVSWSAGSKTIFITQPAEKAVFINGSGDVEFASGQTAQFTSNSSDPVIDIAGYGPNFIRFRQANNFTDTANGVDIAYRTTPDDLLIERSQNASKIAEFGGDDGHAALYFDNSKKLETLTGGVDVTGNITVSGTVDGRDLATDGTKLDGIEASADVTDTANVTAAGALMDSEVTNLAQVKAFDSSDYATAAQGATADAAMPKAGGTFTGDVTFNGDSYNVVWDKSQNRLEFADNARATFGAGGDLQIYHSGSNSAILDSGTGNLIIGANDFQLTNSGITENYIKAFSNGAVELYYDNSKKLETKSDGVDITGELQSDSLDVDGNADISGTLTMGGDIVVEDTSSSSPSPYVEVVGKRNDANDSYAFAGKLFLSVNRTDQLVDANKVLGVIGFGGNHTDGTLANTLYSSTILARSDGDFNSASDMPSRLEFYTGSTGQGKDTPNVNIGTERLRITSGGDVQVKTGHLELGDSQQARFGASQDLIIHHNGSHSFIREQGTGDLRIQATNLTLESGSGELFVDTTVNGAVELYYDNVKKLETTADGVEISSTDDGAGNAPILSLYRHSGSPAGQDHAGSIQFNFQNDADEKILGGRIYLEVDDVSDASEDAAIKIAGLRGTNEQEYLELTFGQVRISGDSLFLPSGKTIQFEGSTNDANETTLTVADPSADRTITLPDATGTVLTTGNSDTPTTTTTAADADFVLVDDGGTMKKITPANLGITAGAASVDDATALAIALG